MQPILLVHTYSKWDILREPPYGLLYLAAYLLERECSVELFDRNIHFVNSLDSDKLLIDTIKKKHYPYIGITAMTAQIKDAFGVARLIKEHSPDTKIILGGTHATALPEYTLNECEYIDYICRGEGEKVLFELVSGNDPSAIMGLSYRKAGQVVSNPDAELLDLEKVPFPARQLVDIDYYAKLGWPFRLGSIQIYGSRGCPRRCTFCARFTKFSKVRYRSVDNILKEVLKVSKDYPRINFINFNDDLFMPNSQELIKFCKLFIKYKLHKRFYWRVCLTVDRVSEEVLLWLKRANCITIVYGFESFSQRILDLVDKGTTVEQNYRAAELTKKYKIPYIAGVMANVPGETKEDIMTNLQFIYKMKPDIVNFFYFRPYVGSPLFQQLLTQGKVNYNWDIYTFGCWWDKRDPWYFSKADKKWLFSIEAKIRRDFNYGGQLRTFYKLVFQKPRILHMVLARRIEEIARQLRRHPEYLWRVVCRYAGQYWAEFLQVLKKRRINKYEI